MARIIDELYCQVDGKVYVSRDETSICDGCAFENKDGSCMITDGRAEQVCWDLGIIWKELEANE